LSPIQQDDFNYVIPQREAEFVRLDAVMMVHAVSVAAGVILALRESACF